MPFASESVILRGGVAVPIAAVCLALELESRGLSLTLDGDVLLVGPPNMVNEDDITAIRRYKQDLLRLVRYVDSEAVQ